MLLNPELLGKLACPNWGNDLIYKEASNTLSCSVYNCIVAIAKNVPVMIGGKEGREINGDS